MSEEKKGMLAAGAAYSIFGLSYLFSKLALEAAEPFTLLCVRFTITFIILNLLVLSRSQKLCLRGKNLLGPVSLGLLEPVLYFFLENYGLKYTTTSFTGIVSSISPIFTAILGAIFLREKPNARQWLCICLSITGVMIVSLGTPGGENTLAGCACLLGAYIVSGSYSVLARHLTKEFTAFEITYIMFTVGFIVFTGLTFWQNGSQTLPVLTAALKNRQFLLSSLFLGIMASVVGYLLTNYSLTRLPATRSIIFSSFSTLVSVLSGVILMHDPFSAVSAAAFLMILAGVWGVNHFAQSSR